MTAPASRVLTADQAWDSYRSASSQPLNDMVRAAVHVAPCTEIAIPRQAWAVLLRHPEVLKAYQELPVVPATETRCPRCGALRAVYRPTLDRSVFERLLQASQDGPVLPGCVIISDALDATVVLTGPGGSYRLRAVLHGP